MLSQELSQKLKTRLEGGLCRRRQIMTPMSSGRVVIENQELINFSSSDYLSLGEDPEIKACFQEALHQHPMGSSGSALVTGYHQAHYNFEQAFAEFVGFEQAVLINSGYTANLALLSALKAHDCDFFVDKQIHASVYDAANLANIELKRFHHNDVQHASKLLNKSCKTHHYLMVESVYSMSGSLACVGPLLALAKAHQGGLLIDDAHGLGVLGHYGRGVMESEAIHPDSIAAVVYPLSKGFNSPGAVIAGNKKMCEAVIQFARPYVYASSLSPVVACALQHMLPLISAMTDKRTHLRNLVNYFRQSVARVPGHWSDSLTPIQQLILGNSELAIALSQHLFNRGCYCVAMRYPTVPKSQACLRVTLTFAHSTQDIDYFVSCLKEFADATY